ncbi:MAG: hypothetical protein CMO55_24105 [Verrucomicrobiales bacterium]|nr:hypothetical protein [Verrucomicrobiales bacterium]
MKRAILVFLKFPEPGRVKTRLAANLGPEEAALAYRKMVCRVFEQCRKARPDAIGIAFDPPENLEGIQAWLRPWLDAYFGEVAWIPQSPGDLGERLEGAVADAFDCFGPSKLAVIGTDCVNLEIEIFDTAWRSLEREKTVVFGPADDGGYYLAGVSEPRPELFKDIPWSSSSTLEASISAAKEAGLSVSLLASRTDIDTLAEWKSEEKELTGRRCVFFDRDGVVNRSPGPGYVLSEGAFHLNPGIPEALNWLKERDWLSILVTSQRGVGKGLMTEDDLDRIHQKMQTELAQSGAGFDGIYAYTGKENCLHLPKPDPEMIVSASESFFIDLRRSYVVGDADRDIEMGKNAGLAGTIRIKGEKPIGIDADWTLQETTEIIELFGEIL